MIEEIDPNRKIIKVLIAIIVILVIVLISTIIDKSTEIKTLEDTVAVNNQVQTNNQITSREEIKKSPNEIQVLPTTVDAIYDNSSWCGTFQLVWNDLLEELALNGKIENDIEIVKNLNQKTFVEEDLSEEYYYKKFGLKTLKLKTEIENGIKKKFNEKSDILDTLDWSIAELNDPNDEQFSKYLFYTMLKRDFKFEKEFTILEDGKFGTTEGVKYFGIDNQTIESVRSQVDVLYYKSKDSYSVVLNSDDKDQVILVKGLKGNNFDEIYKNLSNEKEKFKGDKTFGEKDLLKVPNLDFKLSKEYEDLIGLEFPTNKNATGIIIGALQTIQFKLDNTGGSIKSEAAMEVDQAEVISNEIREFNFDDSFTIFLKEADKEKPYFSANVTDIKLFQTEK